MRRCCVYFFFAAAAAALVFLSQVSVCVCVFLVLRLFFVDFLFFTLLATFRLIKDNSVIIIVFSLPFLLLLYSAVYV